MKPIPETVQIGPWTYRISFTEAGSPREEEFGRCSFDRNELVIYISSALSPQRQATWLLAIVLEIILQNMGVDNHGEVAREVAYNLASAWGASPKVVAFIEGGLLKGRPEWEAKIDDDGQNSFEINTEDLAKEADEALNAMGPRSIFIGKQNDPTRPFYDQPPEPVDLDCDTNHSPMAATNPAHKFKSVGYRTITLNTPNGTKEGVELTGDISQADYAAITNSGWDSFQYAYEEGRLLYHDGWFVLTKNSHIPDVVRNYLNRLGLSVGQALSQGAIKIVDGVFQLTMRDDESSDAGTAEAPAWHIWTIRGQKYIHFSDDAPGHYWCLDGGMEVRIDEYGNTLEIIALNRWAEYHPPLPRMIGEPVRDATGRQYQTIRDDGGPVTRTRILPYGYHPPQAKG